MIFHYFKIAFRNILKYKTQSVISMIGLAVGFTCLPSPTCGYTTKRRMTIIMMEPTECIFSIVPV